MDISVNPDKYGGENSMKTTEALLEGVSHFVQSTVRIEGEKTIYIDPISINGEPKDADAVFVTHIHEDHFSPDDIGKVLKDGGLLVATADVAKKAGRKGFKNILTVNPSEAYHTDGISFETVPSYNTDKNFHKKGSGWVGYVVHMGCNSYYAAGDTDVIPEMRDIKADVAFLPVGGTYTMTAVQAATAANIIKPSVAVPIHFADLVGTIEDARSFIEGLDSGISGVILKK